MVVVNSNMKVNDNETTHLMLKGQIISLAPYRRRKSPKVKLSQAFWFLYPVLFYYCWKGLAW